MLVSPVPMPSVVFTTPLANFPKIFFAFSLVNPAAAVAAVILDIIYSSACDGSAISEYSHVLIQTES